MFRPFRILQVAVTSLFLYACASSQEVTDISTAGHAESASQDAPSIHRTNTGRNTPINAAANKVEGAQWINSNNVVAARGDFTDPAGRLLPEVQEFARQTADQAGIPADLVEGVLAAAYYDPDVARLIAPPKRSGRIRRAWQSYRQRHVDPIRIRRGAEFWQDHKYMLDQTAASTGVPQSIIVAIIGIETVYGQYTGNHRVLDTLATLGFRYPDPARPERQAMFRNQLADLIILHDQGALDAMTAKGSYAGAMGIPQFMPGSLRRYASDGDGDGRIDLTNSVPDAIASVASFLRAHGWVPEIPVFAPAHLPANPALFVQDGLEPQSSWADMKAAGARPKDSTESGWQEHAIGLIDLQDEVRNTHDYRLATPNFFAITHYNRSYFYAAAVTELAHEISMLAGYGGPGLH